MPNWCINNLTISHDDPSMLERFIHAYNRGEVCNTFIRRPESINNSDAFAKNDWYSWNVSHWGTKWDFGKDQYDDPAVSVDNEVVVSFNTVWTPPIPLYEYLVDLGYKIRGSYFEPGCCFCGIYEDGHDNYIDYGGDIEAKDIIPASLWDEFAMEDFFETTENE